MQRNLDIDRQSLRGFLHMVETEYADEFLRVRAPVDLRFESTALVFELDQAGKNPVIVFENLGAQGMAMVTNVAGNRKLLAACLGVDAGDLPTAFRERCQNYIPCETVSRGAWDE
ncbi:MAG: UbiD family decarboxylase, partial [Alphaproteobacteria bacterium]